MNRLLRDFICPPPATRRWERGRCRRRRALFVSSPIGLGHARRDVAIARELRRLHPDLEVDWLAQHPVTSVLEASGERIHPASAALASESRHLESESAEHDLHCFQAIRRMDEILVANFMVFSDLVADEQYDVWIGDEAWELDYYLHENPELKTAAYVWLTDFVGWLPMPDGGEREAFLTADYNAEMIEQIARYPRVRDRAMFVGDPEDVVPDRFGPGLPLIREWTEEHFRFAGYVTGFRPCIAQRPPGACAHELGYRRRRAGLHRHRRGLSGRRAVAATRDRAASRRRSGASPSLRMIIVAGPRIDPATLPAAEGLEIRPFVPDLYRHLAVCDVAIVAGRPDDHDGAHRRTGARSSTSLSDTTSSRTSTSRTGLDRYRAGRRMDFDTASPDAIAEAIAQEIGREVDYLPVAGDGAARAASLIAELL